MESFVVGVLNVFAKVSISPHSSGLPGTDQAEKVISGLMFWGLLACVAGVIIGERGVGGLLARRQPPLRPARQGQLFDLRRRRGGHRRRTRRGQLLPGRGQRGPLAMARARAPYRCPAAAGRPHAAGQRGRSTSRWLLVALAAPVVVVAVFALGRASVGGDSATSAPSPRSAIPGVGPARTVHGVPTGYAHTRAGALAAALNYIGVVGDPGVLFDPAGSTGPLAIAHDELSVKLSSSPALRPSGMPAANSAGTRDLRNGGPAVATEDELRLSQSRGKRACPDRGLRCSELVRSASDA